ncbi:hypothetical protein I3842_14G113300 [Carya illinoinensis]|uniref:Uncharacterized protein n=1 Tax=Carya illinoinensis TaxID=32201 RepID=A0A922AJM6_CARIL|nr:hypothetical protein I3842_14G113300 [Carya illinoinensis]
MRDSTRLLGRNRSTLPLRHLRRSTLGRKGGLKVKLGIRNGRGRDSNWQRVVFEPVQC